MLCLNRHCFDVNKKGFINLANKQTETCYDETLFMARRNVFEKGFYKSVMELIKELVGDAHAVLDAGCGEGYYLDAIDVPFGVGVDLSREAIALAAKERSSQIWCVADLANLPFQAQTFDAVLDILSPANYAAFSRVLKTDGKLIKVYPGKDYLQEIRSIANMPPYDAQRVAKYMDLSVSVVDSYHIHEKFEVTTETFRDFVLMTPLLQSLTMKEKERLATNGCSCITLDLHLAVAQSAKV